MLSFRSRPSCLSSCFVVAVPRYVFSVPFFFVTGAVLPLHLLLTGLAICVYSIAVAIYQSFPLHVDAVG